MLVIRSLHPGKLNLEEMGMNFIFTYLVNQHALPYVEILRDFAILDNLVEEN